MNARSMDQSIAAAATVAVLFYAFLPFLTVADLLGVDRLGLFVSLVAVVGALILYRTFEKRERGIERRSIIALNLYLLFAAYAAIRFMVEAPSPEGASTLMTLLLVNPLFILFALVARIERDLIIRTLFVLSAVYILLLLIAFFIGPGTELTASFAGLLGIEGLFYQNISHFTGLFIVSSLYVLHVYRAWRLWLLVVLIASLVGMLMVGGRAPFVAVVAVLAIHYLYGLPVVRVTRLQRHLVVGLVLLVLASVAMYSVRSEEIVESVMLVKQFSMLLKAIDTSLRVFLFSSAIGLWLTDATTVYFGAGVASFPLWIGQTGAGWYPHNLVLELLSELGAVGLVLFSLPIAYLVAWWWRERPRSVEADPGRWVALLIAVYLLVQAGFSGGLSSSWVFLYFVYLILPANRSRP